ncbi:macrolide transport system ATP-binding/permease protein [Methylobacter tundripaludum]|uniref:Pyoverdine export ATP-binding/permease protein PvdT n=1 Tax=Methylobacter tundripaludum TaxID=173365 RepID=A0A2S6HDN7_9GAMM|nr:MacB family efflux pump subunit [Methylobacter tundripaludum]PPK75572.1 macrolide transport system ATP-binding/permease protein [Methylobacter tundripaludum]
MSAARMPADTPLLELKNIQRFYPNGDSVVRALDDISLTIWPGEFVAIIGQSGSGKSTLMNLIGCLDKANIGSYRVLNQDVAGLDADQLAALRRETFGFVFQRYNLLNNASAAENVEIPALYAGLSKAERHSRALQLLEQLGLANRGDHKPMQLSGGQQQRVAIARALMNDPPVILADEPTGALDSQSGKEVMALLRDLHEEGRTILLITHDEKVAAHAQRIITLRDGKIVGDGVENRSGRPLSPPQHRGIGSAGVAAELLEAAKTALRSLHANLFRTALTLLGIVIGVAAVVTMLAVGQGSQEKVLDQMRAMGTNILSIRPGAPGLRGSSDVATLIPADADAIAELGNVEWTSPERNTRLTVRYGNIDYATGVQGVAPSMTAVREWGVADGDFFDERDMRRYAPVIVLGQTVRQILFPDGGDPLGRYVMVGNIPFEVVGVMEAKGADAQGSDRDDVVFVPLTTGLIRLFGQNYLGGITVKVRDVEQIDSTQQAISDLLISRHQVEDFRIRNMASILATATETQNTFTLMLGIVAAISLLVGGIGVMNIMLVSVTERTREIGIRIATGARRRDILLQFNTEAAVVCTLGGLMGVLLGFAAGCVLRYFDMAVIFSSLPAILAFSCAFGTGLLFGYLPARKAAGLDPVVALAAE